MLSLGDAWVGCWDIRPVGHGNVVSYWVYGRCGCESSEERGEGRAGCDGVG